LNYSASRTIRSISASDNLVDFWLICSDFVLPVPERSLAVTVSIPSTDRSYVTSIFGCPRGPGGIPVKSNVPSKLLSLVIGLSPSKTLIVTVVWLSWYVVNVSFLLAGMVVFLGIRTVMFVPLVSIPSDNGQTSSNRMLPVPVDCSLLGLRMAACTAAPYATASSGFSDLSGSLPLKYSLTSYWTFGIRVDPPTSTISSISLLLILASFNTRSTGSSVFLKISPHKSSNLARVIVVKKSMPS